MISFNKEHEALCKAQEEAHGGPCSAFVVLWARRRRLRFPCLLVVWGAAEATACLHQQEGQRGSGDGRPLSWQATGRVSEVIFLLEKQAGCCRSAVRPSAWLLWSGRSSGLWGCRLCSFTSFSTEIKSLFVFQIYGKVLNCLSLIALGNPILCC